ncbi:GNAT family N-acetyltransferase [Janibacter melonis]|uniref:GNAT family N-acetyltransferase n=1 Tax=Janibacter melonis TaxID=262209 RepID=UPI001E46B68E|nr:GNAT family N-acetyltransferase [Janibacter melonis]MCB5990807.1 GNAT family N-acetyltransferase [Janibacter melonis]
MARRPLRRDRRPALEERPGPVEGSVVRAATAADIGSVIELRILMFEAMGTPDEDLYDPRWRADAARWLQLHLDDAGLAVVVADVGGAVVSCAMGQVVDLMPSPTRPGDVGGLLTNVATFPSHRRRGLSQACVEGVLDWFTQSTRVDVVTLNATAEGAPMYEALGFTPSQFPEMRARLTREPTPPEAG